MSILEALACEIPVVATDVGSVAETVVEGQTGRLIAPGNLDAFCEAVEILLQNASIRGEFGKNGRHRALESGPLEAMVHGYERLVTEIYGRKATSRVPGTKPAKPNASRKRRTEPFGSWEQGKRSSVLEFLTLNRKRRRADSNR